MNFDHGSSWPVHSKHCQRPSCCTRARRTFLRALRLRPVASMIELQKTTLTQESKGLPRGPPNSELQEYMQQEHGRRPIPIIFWAPFPVSILLLGSQVQQEGASTFALVGGILIFDVVSWAPRSRSHRILGDPGPVVSRLIHTPTVPLSSPYFERASARSSSGLQL